MLFLEQPIPAFWLEDRKGFTRVGFFETKLDEGNAKQWLLLTAKFTSLFI